MQSKDIKTLFIALLRVPIILELTTHIKESIVIAEVLDFSFHTEFGCCKV